MSRSTPPHDAPKAKPDSKDESEDELQRLRSLTLSERPASSSSASVLSLANAHATAHGHDEPAPSSSRAAMIARAASAGAAAHRADAVAEMRDRFSLGDYTGALGAAESLLAAMPEHVEAKRCADNCRSVLEQMYAARIGPLDRIPHVAVPREKLQWLSIEHQAGFVLAHVDGVSSLQMIMAACGMPMLDVLRILHELVHSRVIAFR